MGGVIQVSDFLQWDYGSLNGTALNDVTVSNADRSKGAKHNVKPGDTITLAERISITVKPLGVPSNITDRDPETGIHHKGTGIMGSVSSIPMFYCLSGEKNLLQFCCARCFDS